MNKDSVIVDVLEEYNSLDTDSGERCNRKILLGGLYMVIVLLIMGILTYIISKY